LPFQGKLWPAITWQQIELESCSSPVMTRFKKIFWNGVGGLGQQDHDRGMFFG